MSCVWARFLIGSNTVPGQRQSAHSDVFGSRVYACLGVTCHLHFWQNDRGLLRATAVTRGWNGHRIRVSTQSWLWRRKFSCRSCQDSNLQPFDHESSALTNKCHTQQLYISDQNRSAWLVGASKNKLTRINKINFWFKSLKSSGGSCFNSKHSSHSDTLPCNRMLVLYLTRMWTFLA